MRLVLHLTKPASQLCRMLEVFFPNKVQGMPGSNNISSFNIALVMRRCPEDVVSTSTYHTCPSEVGGSIYSGFYSLGSFKRLHIIRDIDMNPPPMRKCAWTLQLPKIKYSLCGCLTAAEHPLEQSSSSTSSASSEEDRTDVTVSYHYSLGHTFFLFTSPLLSA